MHTLLIFKGRIYHPGISVFNWFSNASFAVNQTAEAPFDAFTRGAHEYQDFAPDSIPAWHKNLAIPKECLNVLVHTFHVNLDKLALLRAQMMLISTNVTIIQKNAKSQWHRAFMALHAGMQAYQRVDLLILTRLDIIPVATVTPILQYSLNTTKIVFPFWERTWLWERYKFWLCDTLIVIPKEKIPNFMKILRKLSESDDPLIAQRSMSALMKQYNTTFEVWTNEPDTCGVGGFLTSTQNQLYRMSGRDTFMTRLRVLISISAVIVIAYVIFHVFLQLQLFVRRKKHSLQKIPLVKH